MLQLRMFCRDSADEVALSTSPHRPYLWPMRFAPLLALIFTSTVAQALDWPRFRGSDGNGSWNPPGLPADLSKIRPKLIWKKPVGGGFGGITVASGCVYVMDRQKEPREEERILFAANRDPTAREPGILLIIENVLVVIDTRWQHERFERWHAHIRDFISADGRDRDRALPGCSGRIDHATNLQKGRTERQNRRRIGKTIAQRFDQLATSR